MYIYIYPVINGVVITSSFLIQYRAWGYMWGVGHMSWKLYLSCEHIQQADVR